MSTPVVRPLARALAIALAAAPLLFGVVRAAQTRSDFRYLVVALVSLASAALAFFVGRSGRRVTAARAALSFVVATLAGMGTGFVQGARSVPAVAAVAIAFALCVTLAGVVGISARTAVGR